MRRNKNRILLISLLLSLSLVGCESCTKGVNTTPFTSSVRANDDIASGIKIMVAAEANLEKQSLISPQEGLKIIEGLTSLNGANNQYNSDLSAAILSGNKSALPASLAALRKAVTDLNANGVLGIKSDRAKQVFAITMESINISLGILEQFANKP